MYCTTKKCASENDDRGKKLLSGLASLHFCFSDVTNAL